jgi:hypothetical protein
VQLPASAAEPMADFAGYKNHHLQNVELLEESKLKSQQEAEVAESKKTYSIE